jgi:hypothetical protein
MQENIHGTFGEKIATVIFNEMAEHLQITRTVSEFKVEIPIIIRFSSLREEIKHLKPFLSNLWGEVCVIDRNHKTYPVGKISQPEFQKSYRPNNDCRATLNWTGDISALAFFEKIRDGEIPKIHLSVSGEYCYLVSLQNLPKVDIRTEPQTFEISKNLEISKEIWIERLRKIDFLENILIEIPLPDSPGSPWDDVWKAIVEARDAFEKGGTTAWKNCIVSCRLALEKWQKIEKEQMGAGWKAPSPADRQLRTKEERLDNIRWHLLQLGHHSAHTHADNWNRNDALIMLSTLSALLAERNP